MKKTIFLLALLPLLFSCNKFVEDIAGQIDIPYETTVDIPGTAFIVPAGTELKGSQEKSFDKVPGNYIEARLRKIDLSVNLPADMNFGVVREINMYIYTDAANGNLPMKLVATKKDIPANAGKDLTIDGTGEDVVAYVTKAEYIVKTEVILRQLITQDVQLKSKLTFRVKPDL